MNKNTRKQQNWMLTSWQDGWMGQTDSCDYFHQLGGYNCVKIKIWPWSFLLSHEQNKYKVIQLFTYLPSHPRGCQSIPHPTIHTSKHPPLSSPTYPSILQSNLCPPNRTSIHQSLLYLSGLLYQSWPGESFFFFQSDSAKDKVLLRLTASRSDRSR